jgi:ligand-binding SRPBCC domain-containing protein
MRLNTELWVSTTRHEVFRSFQDAAALESMSPPWVHCRMITPAPTEMRLNARIEYRFRLHGIPFRWEAVVTVWDPPYQFVDEQRRGPYRRWKHTHTFVEDHGGTMIRDDIEFEVSGGSAVGWLVVRDLRKVFRFRHQALLLMFKQPHPWSEPSVVIGAS